MESSWNDLEVGLLYVELKKAVEEFCQTRGSDANRQKLLQVLQNNECREVIAKCVDGDIFSNAFVWAGYRNHVDILDAFLYHGMNVDIKNCDGWNALIWASLNGLEESVRYLLAQNANVDIQDKYGRTALMYASRHGHKEIIQLLLDHNADIGLKSNTHSTAYDYTKREEIKEMIQNHVNTSYVLK